jgi:hypothetical protein
MSSKSTPGLPGLAGIVLSAGATCAVITATSGAWLPWLTCGAGIVVGLWAVQAVNRK